MKVALAVVAIGGVSAINIRSQFGRAQVQKSKLANAVAFGKKVTRRVSRRVVAGVKEPAITEEEVEQPEFTVRIHYTKYYSFL